MLRPLATLILALGLVAGASAADLTPAQVKELVKATANLKPGQMTTVTISLGGQSFEITVIKDAKGLMTNLGSGLVTIAPVVTTSGSLAGYSISGSGSESHFKVDGDKAVKVENAAAIGAGQQTQQPAPQQQQQQTQQKPVAGQQQQQTQQQQQQQTQTTLDLSTQPTVPTTATETVTTTQADQTQTITQNNDISPN